MAKRIVLSFLVFVMVIGLSFTSTSFALTDEQEQIVTRIDRLDSMFQKKRAEVRQIMSPETATQDKSTYMYDKGLTKVCFNPKSSVAYYIEAAMPANHNLTMPIMQEALRGKGMVLPMGTQMFVMKEGYYIILSFNRDQKCTLIQFVQTA